jgi:hypothetical protein
MAQSLCNACGIRQRKARRAMMAAASTSGPAAVPATDSDKASPSNAAGAAAAHPKVKKEKRSVDVDRSLPFKKRCKVVQVQQDHAAAVAAPAAATDRPAVVVQQAATAAEVGDDDACPSRDLLVDDIGGLISWSRSPPAAPASADAASCSFRASPALPVQQDEITDAAMLLMTLSCGLVRS